MTSKFNIDNRELLQRISCGEAVVGIDFGNLIVRELAAFRLAAMDSEPHTDDELSNLLWYSQEATCHSDPNYYCEFQRLATPGLIAWIIRELQERRKADSEPVRNPVLAYADSYRDMAKQGVESVPVWSVITDLERNIAPLYRHAQPAPACESITVTDDMAYAFHHALTDSMIGADDVEEIKTGLRAVFANLTAPVVSAEYPDRLPCSVLLEPGLRFGKGIKTSTMLAALARRAVYESDMAALSPEEIAEFQARIEDFKALIAQPAPVVPEEATPDSIEILASARRRDHAVFQWDEDQRNAAADSWNACRAAMLHGSEPVTTACKLPDDFDFDRFNDVTWLDAVATNPHMHSLTTSIIAMVALELNKRLEAGNSPAQSDCCPAQNSVAPAQSPIDHGYRSECECSGCKATARTCADLSANSPANPGCWCRTCRPVVLNDMRFVVCPDCGNKRCPRANDHRNACTGSNEPGQEGSAYPADPQEVPDGK